MEISEAIETLADAGLLTERQAQAWVYRDVEAVPREAAADHMGVSANVLDKHLRAARDKIEAAEATVEAAGRICHEELPSECEECGAALGGAWATDDRGQPLCFDCAGVTVEELP